MNSMLNVISYVSFSICYFFVSSLANEPLNNTIHKPIKGQQFTTETTVATLEGGPIPEGLMLLLTNNGVFPENFTFVAPQNESNMPLLIVDEVKTIRTRLTIPLSSGFADSERYRVMLRQFLVDNQINLTKNDPLESPTDAIPETKLLIYRLHLASILKNNLVSILGQILYEQAHKLPDKHHAPLAHVYHLLRLNRMPVIDLLKALDKLGAAGIQEQWILILSQLEKSMPEYMKSCATFLLESLQELTLDMEQLTEDIEIKVLSRLPKEFKNIRFPKNVIQKVKQNYIKTLGHTLAVMLTYFIESNSNWTPQLLGLWIQIFPRNSANPIIDHVALQMITNRPTSEESVIVKKAFNTFIKNDLSIFEIFKNILQNIEESSFIGHEKYAILQKHYQIPAETYAISNYQEMVPILSKNPSSIINLFDVLVPNDAIKTILSVKQNILKYLLKNQNSSQLYSRYSAESPFDLMQILLFRLSVVNDKKLKFEKNILEIYLYLMDKKSRSSLNLMEISVYNYLVNGNFENMEDRILDVLEAFLLNFCWSDDKFSGISDLKCNDDRNCFMGVMLEATKKTLFKNNLCNNLATQLIDIL